MSEHTIRTTILLVRHGECRGNVEGLFRGRVDFPLNETGLRQAEEVAGTLASYRPEAVFSSPLLRASQTAEAIAKASSAPLLVDEGFNNICLGIWEGRPKTEIADQFPEMWRTWLENPEALSVEGAESLNDVLVRSKASLDRIVAEYRGKTVVAVTHRTVVKPLLAGCLGIPSPYFWKTHMDTAAYSVLHFDDIHGYSLFCLNQTHHLSHFTTEWI
jgi:broad specificity phosphatase PhoE